MARSGSVARISSAKVAMIESGVNSVEEVK
jgi:hypothetical protein